MSGDAFLREQQLLQTERARAFAQGYREGLQAGAAATCIVPPPDAELWSAREIREALELESARCQGMLTIPGVLASLQMVRVLGWPIEELEQLGYVDELARAMRAPETERPLSERLLAGLWRARFYLARRRQP